MTRTHRFLGGVAIGYVQMVLVTVTGLWMTPFLLTRLGEHSLGLWLIAQQLLGYLLLMDVGVAELLPREIAFVTGRAGGVSAQGAAAADLPHVIARARQAIGWQTPAVAVAAIASWYWMPPGMRGAAGPVSILLVSFVLLFPARLYQAFLQGVQELPFLGRVQLAAWAATTAVTIALVLAGASLYALVIGWALGQGMTAAAGWLRISSRYHEAWPSFGVRSSWADVRSYLVQSVWISVAQVAQVFLTGSDLLLVGAVLGTGPVVLYSCTGKLATVLSNHPQLIMQAATPALSEMRATERRDTLQNTSVVLMLAMLSLSGLVASVILALNGSFVRWWVGPAQYGGDLLTAFFALQLILRHWNITLIYGLFCFRKERRISITNLVDGAVSIGAGFAMIHLIGPLGAIIGSLVAVVFVSLPANLIALAHETGTTPLQLTGKLWPWMWRFAAVATACGLLPLVWRPGGVVQMILVGVAVTVFYGTVMLHGLSGGPLDRYARPRLLGVLPGAWRLRLSSANL
jgi:O-antigen/teichoic acid export membrane protein